MSSISSSEYSSLKNKYDHFKALGTKLNIARGVPSREQLELSMPMLDVLSAHDDFICESGIDTRTYGCIDGIPEAKRLMAAVMETGPDNIIIFCDSSLNIMYDIVSKSWSHGVLGSTPWCRLDKVKFLCVVPGYDRHFAITESFGIEMINIPMLSDGPDMDLVEKLVSSDESIKGIWCVPKYSNPTGTVYSDETVFRMANLKPAAKDFRVYWDNAYNVHHLDPNNKKEIPEILALCEKAGNPDLVYKFGSFSKISFPGSSIAALATSVANKNDVLAQMKIQTIGHNKINQLQHVRFFKDVEGVHKHMALHAAILKPKFDLVEKILTRDLSDLENCSWTHPNGGYFVSFDAPKGTAKKIVSMMKEAGVIMTSAGATFPYGKDPNDSNIRIAPSFAEMDELESALNIFTVCVKIAAYEMTI